LIKGRLQLRQRRSWRILDVRAADLQEEMADQRFWFRQLRRRRRQSSERRNQITRDARAAPKKSNRIDAYLVCGRKSVFLREL
jgi:hypothetical protein